MYNIDQQQQNKKWFATIAIQLKLEIECKL